MRTLVWLSRHLFRLRWSMLVFDLQSRWWMSLSAWQHSQSLQSTHSRVQWEVGLDAQRLQIMDQSGLSQVYCPTRSQVGRLIPRLSRTMNLLEAAEVLVACGSPAQTFVQVTTTPLIVAVTRAPTCLGCTRFRLAEADAVTCHALGAVGNAGGFVTVAFQPLLPG